MLLHFLKAKIHRATITEANLHYQGSISIGMEMLKSSGIVPFEKVAVYNITNGERFETYAIEGQPGMICLNGAAAWKGRVGDKIIIASYCMLTEEESKQFKPSLVFVDDKNRVTEVTHERRAVEGL